ncbi:MAG: DNA-binding protein WhiA [Erysipelotrichaceae bacterium]|nr:DNA-binding protein WhiA [Erysipelotrichaceae bacterium]
MSFSTDIKKELSSIELDDCCKRAELSALIQLTSSLSIVDKKMQLVVKSENPTTAKRVVYLLKKLYKAQTELSYIQKNNLKKNKIYQVTVHEDAKKILEDLGLYNENKGLLNHPVYSILVKNCCAKNYLAGCFLAYGACNSPNNKNYHLEIALNDLDYANYLIKIISRFNIYAKISKRRNKYVVYLKKADDISDFLRIINASNALYEFEDTRIGRDMKHSIIRVDNCEIANEMKILKAAEEQVNYMNKIKESGKYKDLDPKLQHIIDIRLKYKDYSLKELCDAYFSSYGEELSKSGLKHRLNKIESIAGNL